MVVDSVAGSDWTMKKPVEPGWTDNGLSYSVKKNGIF
ncbi:hypothetical protein MITS9504_00272 [Synechococcus sp. MIT S9504]|nr:hypothetical protein MITS9504_00272 [Synechococcus sp. MIT S9504]